METVVAISGLVEAYAVNADEFFQLFNNSHSTIDELSFEDIVIQEVVQQIEWSDVCVLSLSLLLHRGCVGFEILFASKNCLLLIQVSHFKMLPDLNAPTAFGVPLFISFSCVSVTVVSYISKDIFVFN